MCRVLVCAILTVGLATLTADQSFSQDKQQEATRIQRDEAAIQRVRNHYAVLKSNTEQLTANLSQANSIASSLDSPSVRGDQTRQAEMRGEITSILSENVQLLDRMIGDVVDIQHETDRMVKANTITAADLSGFLEEEVYGPIDWEDTWWKYSCDDAGPCSRQPDFEGSCSEMESACRACCPEHYPTEGVSDGVAAQNRQRCDFDCLCALHTCLVQQMMGLLGASKDRAMAIIRKMGS